jgi:hypothetical protein
MAKLTKDQIYDLITEEFPQTFGDRIVSLRQFSPEKLADFLATLINN